jgi:hypothetical protein
VVREPHFVNTCFPFSNRMRFVTRSLSGTDLCFHLSLMIIGKNLLLFILHLKFYLSFECKVGLYSLAFCVLLSTE